MSLLHFYKICNIYSKRLIKLEPYFYVKFFKMNIEKRNKMEKRENK